MNEKDYGVEQGFYENCAKLLNNAEHTYKPFTDGAKRTRWNNRSAGNGRYPGNGIVRMFGPNCISVALLKPKLSGTFTSPDAALAAIKSAMETT
jgi:hypothetical protein